MALPVDRLNPALEGEFTFRGRRYGVPFTLPGDLVQFQLERRGRKRNSLRVVKIERAATYPEDIPLAEPFCALHGRCGGCRGQHLDYAYQLALKADPVRRRMRETYAIDPSLREAPELRRFRGRMDFAVDADAVGLRPAGDFASFVDIAGCPVQSAAADRALEIFRGCLAAAPELAFRREDESGVIKYVTIRSGPASTLLALTIANERREDPDYLRFRDKLSARLATAATSGADGAQPGADATEAASATTLVETYSETGADLSCPPGGRAVSGDARFTMRLGGQDFRVPYDAFFQPNPQAFDVLLDWCFAKLDERFASDAPAAPGGIVDLYAGMGVLASLIVRRYPDRFDTVRGIDFTPSAVERAAALFPETIKVDFQAHDLNRPPEDLFASETPHKLIVLDPPRAGLSPALAKRIARDRPAPLLLYISCNPKTQLRDLDDFLAAAYRPLDACIVDCFPFTPHLEQAVLLERR